MRELTVDVAVVGGGSAGQAARHEAAGLGATVLVVEPGTPSTTCASAGCMPSKLLIAAANEAHDARRAPRFGVMTPIGVQIDGAAVLRRVRCLRDRFVRHTVDSTREWADDQLVRGHARFVTPTTLAVDDDLQVHARAVVLATGATPHVPAEIAALGELVLTSDDVFELEELPRSLAVVGGGLIGVEVGQALARLGVEVLLFERGRRVGLFREGDMADEAARLLARDSSFDLLRDSTPEFRRSPDAVNVRWTEGDDTREATVDRVLCATGRRPNTDHLGLREAGVELDDDGVPVSSPTTRQCGDLPLFVAGDVSADEPMLHVAARDGALAGKNAATYPDLHPQRRQVPLQIAFSEPQMALVGARADDVEEQERVVGEASFEAQGRAVIADRNGGRVRVFAHRSRGTLEGAELLCPDAEHLAHLLAWSIQGGCSVHDLLDMPYYHPTLEEGLRTALQNAARAG